VSTRVPNQNKATLHCEKLKVHGELDDRYNGVTDASCDKNDDHDTKDLSRTADDRMRQFSTQFDQLLQLFQRGPSTSIPDLAPETVSSRQHDLIQEWIAEGTHTGEALQVMLSRTFEHLRHTVQQAQDELHSITKTGYATFQLPASNEEETQPAFPRQPYSTLARDMLIELNEQTCLLELESGSERMRRDLDIAWEELCLHLETKTRIQNDFWLATDKVLVAWLGIILRRLLNFCFIATWKYAPNSLVDVCYSLVFCCRLEITWYLEPYCA
ncbi:hypothetical protein FGIG_02228, partial [Fasciola gigantica]